MVGEYGKWPEFEWTAEELNWKKAASVTAGVDIGTTSAQAAILCDGEIFGYASARVGADFKAVANHVIDRAIGRSGMTLKDIDRIAATGFGYKNAPDRSKAIDEIQCHGKGARYLFGPNVKTVVDLGGQTTKAILLYDWDRIREFKISDKCASGIGRKVEMTADLLQIPIEDLGGKSLDIDMDIDPEPVSTTCGNFMYPEVIGLLRKGYREEAFHENEILASYLFAIAWRILGTIGKLAPLDIGDIEIEEGIGFTGGLAKNIGITGRLERELNLTALRSELDPQLAGAIGAALLA